MKYHFGDNLVIEKKRDVRTDYDIVRQIGKGSIACIYLAIKKQNEQQNRDDTTSSKDQALSPATTATIHYYAIKEIDVSLIRPEYTNELKNEVALLRTLDHPNIVRVFEVYEGHHHHLSIVMEACKGGNLHARAPYTEQQAQRIVLQIVEAVNYLHNTRGIMHRDIKFENIMFEEKTPEAEIKLIDFGLSIRYQKNSVFKDIVGTIGTMSPEVLRGKYNSQADMWAIGVVTYQLLSGGKPFLGYSRRHVMQQIVKSKYQPMVGPRWDRISKEAKAFISNLLTVNPAHRYTAERALTDPWLANLLVKDEKLDESDATFTVHNLERFSFMSELRKLALQAIAQRASMEQVARVRSIFQTIDFKHDGSVTLEELKMALSDSSEYDEGEIETLFRQADVDGCGTIHYREFLAAALASTTDIELDRITDAFQTFDRSEKGYIDRNDLRSVLQTSDNYIDNLMHESDTDGDGKISFSEFKDLVLGRGRAQVAAVMDATDRQV